MTTATSDPIASTETTRDGVTVERALVREREDMVAVWFRFSADAPEDRTVRVVEELPGAVTHDDVGLHPEYGGDDWRRGHDGLAFATTVAEAPTVTMYAVRDLEGVPAVLASPPTTLEVALREASDGRTHPRR